jgi:hypothetical protein
VIPDSERSIGTLIVNGSLIRSQVCRGVDELTAALPGLESGNDRERLARAEPNRPITCR